MQNITHEYFDRKEEIAELLYKPSYMANNADKRLTDEVTCSTVECVYRR